MSKLNQGAHLSRRDFLTGSALAAAGAAAAGLLAPEAALAASAERRGAREISIFKDGVVL